nr:hypothetical protein [Tanacetum cinerariifolium]
TESDPEEAPSEVEESQPLGSSVPLMSEEFEASEPSCTMTVSSHSLVSLDSTAPLSPDHPLTHPTLPSSMSARIVEAADLSPSSFYKRYRSSYETPSPSSSLTLLVGRDIEGLDEEGQQLAILVVNTATNEPLGLGYRAARRHALKSTEEITPSTYEAGQSFRSVLEQEGVERISAFKQPTLVTRVDPEDDRVYTDILTYAPPAAPVQTLPSSEWLLGSLPVSPSSLVIPSPIASPVATPAQDLRELYTRSGAVKDEIFSKRYRFRSLVREKERATMTFRAIWRSVLDLKAWSGQTDAQREDMWHTIYDIQRENHDLKRQLTEERRERLELTNHVARMERRHEFGGE